MKQFYSAKLVQVNVHRQGVDPEPPKPKGYTKSAGAGGVLQILAKIIRDCEAEEQELHLSESAAQADYERLVKDTNDSINADREALSDKDEQLSTAKGEKAETEENQVLKGNELERLDGVLSGYHQECDFILKYFDLRQQSRQEEMDGINQAKAILSGANFD